MLASLCAQPGAALPAVTASTAADKVCPQKRFIVPPTGVTASIEPSAPQGKRTQARGQPPKFDADSVLPSRLRAAPRAPLRAAPRSRPARWSTLPASAHHRQANPREHPLLVGADERPARPRPPPAKGASEGPVARGASRVRSTSAGGVQPRRARRRAPRASRGPPPRRAATCRSRRAPRARDRRCARG